MGPTTPQLGPPQGGLIREIPFLSVGLLLGPGGNFILTGPLNPNKSLQWAHGEVTPLLSLGDQFCLGMTILTCHGSTLTLKLSAML